MRDRDRVHPRRARIPAFLNGVDVDTATFCHQLGGWLAALAFQMALGLVTLAGLDYGFQLWKFEHDIKMTKQEIRDEMRHMEGDPHIRQRRREAHRKLINARKVQQTKNADVVITNPTELAIAIKYDPNKMDAPVVLAKGKDLLAAQIRRVAAEHGIPIVEKKPLAQALYRMVKVGQAIPGDLYEGVAEILAYVYRLVEEQSDQRPRGQSSSRATVTLERRVANWGRIALIEPFFAPEFFAILQFRTSICTNIVPLSMPSIARNHGTAQSTDTHDPRFPEAGHSVPGHYDLDSGPVGVQAGDRRIRDPLPLLARR